MARPISVIIPVLGEGETIQQTLSHLNRPNFLRYMEIIVVDGDSSGSTLRRIHPNRIKAITAPKGRGLQMNRGAAIAEGNILLFLHADTRLPDTAPQAILTVCRQPHIAGGAFNLGIEAAARRFRAIETLVRIRTRINRIPYGDQAIFIKRHIFRNLGGYPEIPIMEDVALMRRIKMQGRKIAILPGTVKTSARRWKREGFWRCTLRNRSILLLYAAGVSPAWLARFYPCNPPDPDNNAGLAA